MYKKIYIYFKFNSLRSYLYHKVREHNWAYFSRHSFARNSIRLNHVKFARNITKEEKRCGNASVA